MTGPHDGVGAYLVDALESQERAEFEAHLATCESCRQQVRELSEAVSELSLLRPVAPPPALRSSVLAAISQVRQLPPQTPHGTAQSAPPEIVPEPGGPWPSHEIADSPGLGDASHLRAVDTARVGDDRYLDAGGASDIGPIAAPTPVGSSRAAGARGAWIVAAAMAFVVGLGGWVYAMSQRRVAEAAAEQLAEQRQAAQARSEAEAALLAAADVRTYPTALPDGKRVAFVVSQEQNRALFIGPDLPPAGPGHQYQLWTIHAADDVRPDAVFDGAGTTSTFFTGTVQGAAQLAVTIEPAGGSEQPTLPIQAAASL